MNVIVKTAEFNASPDTVFEFMSNLENLPKWATNYAKSIRKDGDGYMVDTPAGELFQSICADRENGVLDMHSGPTKEKMWTWPVRVMPDNKGGSILNFTAIRMPDQPLEQFKEQCEMLGEEFENIRKAVEV